jgi:hypothetical protein
MRKIVASTPANTIPLFNRWRSRHKMPFPEGCGRCLSGRGKRARHVTHPEPTPAFVSLSEHRQRSRGAAIEGKNPAVERGDVQPRRSYRASVCAHERRSHLRPPPASVVVVADPHVSSAQLSRTRPAPPHMPRHTRKCAPPPPPAASDRRSAVRRARIGGPDGRKRKQPCAIGARRPRALFFAKKRAAGNKAPPAPPSPEPKQLKGGGGGCAKFFFLSFLARGRGARKKF